MTFKSWGCLVVLCCLAACSAPADPAPTPDVAAIVAATVSAQQTAFFQPQLIAPDNGVAFDDPTQVRLAWDWVRELETGEAYDVRVWQAGQPDYGIAWTQADEFPLADWLSQREPGEYFWSVAVITGEDGTVTSTIGEAPPPQSFTISSVTLPTPTPEPTPELLTADQLLRIEPDGFVAEMYAYVNDLPTVISVMLFDDDGSMLLLTVDGRIYRLLDSDGDGFAEERQQILDNGEDSIVQLEWAVGLARYEDRLYVSDKGRIGYLEDGDGDGRLDSYRKIIDGLPSRIYPLHSNNGVAFDAAGKLYVGIGSTTDHGPLNPEYPYEATILRMNPDGSEVEIFATGFRNPYDLAFSPEGRLFTADNGPDQMDQVMSFYPPEELNYVRQGRDYGFPDVYGYGQTIRPRDDNPEPAVSELETSSVSVGLTYYSAEQFPEFYRDGIFVAQFGGFTTSGEAVVFVPLEETADGGYIGQWQPFINFASGHKPVDVAVGPDGALYVAEYVGGHILRIRYTGDTE